MSFDDFKALIGLSFRDPQGAARALLGQGGPVQARWMALLAAVSVSASRLAPTARAGPPAPSRWSMSTSAFAPI